MVLGAAAIVKGFLILVNRVASWFGSGYFLRKGFRSKKKRYFFVSLLISATMLWLLWLIRH